MSALIEIKTSADWTECCQCGVGFGSPVIPYRRKDGRDIWCPNGHVQHWRESEADKLRKQLVAEQERVAKEQQRTAMERQMRIDEESRRKKLERKLKRVDRGVCPECNRTFENLARHMNCKHTIIAPKEK